MDGSALSGFARNLQQPSTLWTSQSLLSMENLETTLFEKAMNLYLYIPPHSAHPRGVFTGLIFGQILRICRLCSKKRDADNKIMEFFHRLLARGHTRENLGPLFSKAEKNAAAFLARSEEEHAALRKQKWSDSHNQVFFHLQYHPEDPPSKEIQKLWQELVSNPAGETRPLRLVK
jgi:hypothetical protein